MRAAAAELADVPATPSQPGDSTLEPVDFLLSVMRDPCKEMKLRVQCASLAAPYRHARKGEASGKKAERQDAAEAVAGGKFKPATPPKLVVNNRK